MGNYELRTRVAQLENDLRQVKSINSQLRNEIATILKGVNNANKELNDYNNFVRNTLDTCNNSMRSSTDTVIAAYELQGEIEHLYKRYKNIELANKKIRACNNQRYYDFANYRTVRKIVQGMMDNLDVNMVSERIIFKSIETQHLQTPNYWLTCVLISIMAWKSDDKELALKAIEQAIRLDKKSSSIFYMIFNLRMARDDAALKWFNLYQQCNLKGSDQKTFLMLFSLISKTLNDNIHEDTKSEISAFIKQVIVNNAKAEGFSEEDIVEQIRLYFKGLQQTVQFDYPLLRKCCSEASCLTEVLRLAENNNSILEFILKVTQVTAAEKNEYLSKFIVDLVSSPNEAEKEVYSEMAFNELIILKQGDIEAARAVFQEQSLREAKDLNLIAEMIDWIYSRDASDINGQVRLNAFNLTKDFQVKAVKLHCENYRSKFRTKYEMLIDDYHTEMNFQNEAEEKKKITDFYLVKKHSALAQVKDIKAYFGFGIAGLSLISAFFVGYWLFAFTVAGMGYGTIQLLLNKTTRKQIENNFEEKRKSCEQTTGKLFEEFKSYLNEYRQYDNIYEQIQNELARN